METFFSIIAIIAIFIIFGAISDNKSTKEQLREQGMLERFGDVIRKINEEFHEGKGEIIRQKYNRILLVKRTESIMFEFYYNKLILYVFVHYKWFHQDKQQMLSYVKASEYTDFGKARIVSEVLQTARQIRAMQIQALLLK